MSGLLAVRRAPLLRGGRIGKSLFERTKMMECKIKPGHIPSPWDGVAVGATWPNVSKQRRGALSAQKCRVCWPCAEHPPEFSLRNPGSLHPRQLGSFSDIPHQSHSACRVGELLQILYRYTRCRCQERFLIPGTGFRRDRA